MGDHIDAEGRFQSDKYPTCPAGKVPLSTRDRTAQDLLWRYAQRRRAVDPVFAADLEACLRADGYDPMAIAMRDHDGAEVALFTAAKQFLIYEKNHRDKKTVDGDEKAEVNRRMAELCMAYLTGPKPEPVS